MEIRYDQQKLSDASVEQLTSNELVMRIRKLRWMGFEEQAVMVQDELSLRRAATDSVVAASSQTD